MRFENFGAPKLYWLLLRRVENKSFYEFLPKPLIETVGKGGGSVFSTNKWKPVGSVFKNNVLSSVRLDTSHSRPTGKYAGSVM